MLINVSPQGPLGAAPKCLIITHPHQLMVVCPVIMFESQHGREVLIASKKSTFEHLQLCENWENLKHYSHRTSITWGRNL